MYQVWSKSIEGCWSLAGMGITDASGGGRGRGRGGRGRRGRGGEVKWWLDKKKKKEGATKTK
jgi:hypothetical protein